MVGFGSLNPPYLSLLKNRRERRKTKARGGEKPECTRVHEDFEPTKNAGIPSVAGFLHRPLFLAVGLLPKQVFVATTLYKILGEPFSLGRRDLCGQSVDQTQLLLNMRPKTF